MGRNGKINGEVHAKKLIIQGMIDGSAEADRVEIHADGKMLGKVTSSELVIEALAIFEGESHFKARPELPTSKKKTVKKEPIAIEEKTQEPKASKTA